MVPQERQVLQHILQIDEIRLLLVQEQEMELDYLLAWRVTHAGIGGIPGRFVRRSVIFSMIS